MRLPERTYLKMHAWALQLGTLTDTAYIRADVANAEIERLKAENCALIVAHGKELRNVTMRSANRTLRREIERLKKVADQAIERADLRLAKDSDAGYCELNQRLPVWSCFHSDLHAYLKEKENG